MVRFLIVNQQHTAQFSLIHEHDSYEPVLVMNRSKKIEELTGLNQSDALFNELFSQSGRVLSELTSDSHTE